jgi:hypothetical protein
MTKSSKLVEIEDLYFMVEITNIQDFWEDYASKQLREDRRLTDVQKIGC